MSSMEPSWTALASWSGLLPLLLVACGGAASDVGSASEPAATAARPAVAPAAQARGDEATSEPAAGPPPATELAPVFLVHPQTPLPVAKVLVRRAGRVRLSQDGLPVAALDASYPLDGEPVLAAVAETPEHMQVVSTWGNARLLLWVERADLADVVVREATLEGGAPPRGITLRPGAPVEVTERARGRVRVRRADDELEFEGWISADAIGHVFRPAGEAEPVPSVGRGFVSCRTELAATPGGPAIAILAPRDEGECDAHVELELLSEPHAGHVEVAIDSPAYRARGFATGVGISTTETRGYGTLYSFGRAGRGEGGQQVVLPAGTCLHAERYGEPVGVVTHKVVFARGEVPAERSWVAGRIETRWGDVAVWAFVESAAEDRWRRCE